MATAFGAGPSSAAAPGIMTGGVVNIASECTSTSGSNCSSNNATHSQTEVRMDVLDIIHACNPPIVRWHSNQPALELTTNAFQAHAGATTTCSPAEVPQLVVRGDSRGCARDILTSLAPPNCSLAVWGDDRAKSSAYAPSSSSTASPVACCAVAITDHPEASHTTNTNTFVKARREDVVGQRADGELVLHVKRIVEIFDEAQCNIFNLMVLDPFPRFIRHKLYAQLLQKLSDRRRAQLEEERAIVADMYALLSRGEAGLGVVSREDIAAGVVPGTNALSRRQSADPRVSRKVDTQSLMRSLCAVDSSNSREGVRAELKSRRDCLSLPLAGNRWADFEANVLVPGQVPSASTSTEGWSRATASGNLFN